METTIRAFGLLVWSILILLLSNGNMVPVAQTAPAALNEIVTNKPIPKIDTRSVSNEPDTIVVGPAQTYRIQGAAGQQNLVKSARYASYSLSCPPEAAIHPCTCIHHSPDSSLELEDTEDESIYELAPTPQAQVLVVNSANPSRTGASPTRVPASSSTSTTTKVPTNPRTTTAERPATSTVSVQQVTSSSTTEPTVSTSTLAHTKEPPTAASTSSPSTTTTPTTTTTFTASTEATTTEVTTTTTSTAATTTSVTSSSALHSVASDGTTGAIREPNTTITKPTSVPQLVRGESTENSTRSIPSATVSTSTTAAAAAATTNLAANDEQPTTRLPEGELSKKAAPVSRGEQEESPTTSSSNSLSSSNITIERGPANTDKETSDRPLFEGFLMKTNQRPELATDKAMNLSGPLDSFSISNSTDSSQSTGNISNQVAKSESPRQPISGSEPALIVSSSNDNSAGTTANIRTDEGGRRNEINLSDLLSKLPGQTGDSNTSSAKPQNEDASTMVAFILGEQLPAGWTTTTTTATPSAELPITTTAAAATTTATTTTTTTTATSLPQLVTPVKVVAQANNGSRSVGSSDTVLASGRIVSMGENVANESDRRPDVAGLTEAPKTLATLPSTSTMSTTTTSTAASTITTVATSTTSTSTTSPPAQVAQQSTSIMQEGAALWRDTSTASPVPVVVVVSESNSSKVASTTLRPASVAGQIAIRPTEQQAPDGLAEVLDPGRLAASNQTRGVFTEQTGSVGAATATAASKQAAQANSTMAIATATSTSTSTTASPVVAPSNEPTLNATEPATTTPASRSPATPISTNVNHARLTDPRYALPTSARPLIRPPTGSSRPGVSSSKPSLQPSHHHNGNQTTRGSFPHKPLSARHNHTSNNHSRSGSDHIATVESPIAGARQILTPLSHRASNPSPKPSTSKPLAPLQAVTSSASPDLARPNQTTTATPTPMPPVNPALKPRSRRMTRFLTSDAYLLDGSLESAEQPKIEVVAYCRNIQNPQVLKDAIKGFRGHQVNYFVIDSCKVPPFPNDLFSGIDVRWLEMSNSTVQFHNNFLHSRSATHHHHHLAAAAAR